MGDGYNFQQLKAAILALSRATDWEVAKKEWRLVEISEADEPENRSVNFMLDYKAF